MGAHRQALGCTSGSVTLHILSAGAAKAVVNTLAKTFTGDERAAVAAVFNAAGTIRAQFVAGEPCDVLILPVAMLDALAAEQRIDASTHAPLGHVPTGIAVAAGVPAPQIGDAVATRSAFEHASAIYCPDTQRSTAGLHVVRVLHEMGLHARVAARIRDYANGAEAMAALAALGTHRERAIGCTQVTEILYTPGVTLIGVLPPPFELTTIYSVAVSSQSCDPERARRFAALLTSPHSEALRVESGFAQR